MESIWSQSCSIPERERLNGDMETEIVVIGGGMAGILTAALLEKEGRRVTVLEAKRIGGGQTRNTTAKITSQHGMIYRSLAETLGEIRARQYAMANQTAVSEYWRLIEEEGIPCDFEDRDAYVYGNDVQNLRAEAETAVRLGLPAEFSTELSIPLPAAGAVRFRRQGQFHPLKFLKAISEPLTIFEQTPVQTVEGTALVTERGIVRAEKVIFTTHYPIINFPGMYFARMHQERSYVLALENAGQVDGMYIGAEAGGYSFRNYGELLLFGGEGHRTGENSRGGRYDALRRKARELFPDSREVACWSAQDCVTPDSVPYIGQYASNRPDWYVATGFQKWGMTSSMAAAMILRDAICGRENPWAEVFDPGRFDGETFLGVAGETGQAVKGLARNLFKIPDETAKKLPLGQGGVVFLEGEKTGVYKEEDGTIHAVDIRCPHLGCQLEWNPDEKSWDCPCHGSRFDYKGNWLCGPAQEDISQK